MLYRIKEELKSPRYLITKPIAVCTEFFQILIRRLTNLRGVDDIGDVGNHLLVVYDLNTNAITFDFAYFLACAEIFAEKNEKEKLFVLFVLKENNLYSKNTYMDVIDEASQKWRLNHILIPLANVYPRCVGYSVLPNEDSIKTFLSNSLIFPKGYSNTFKPLMNYTEIFKSLELKTFDGIRASTQGVRYIDKWRRNKRIYTPIVCITLRQYGYDTCRNSNIDAWVRFADWVFERGYTPVFIPDTDACWEPDERIDRYHVFNEGCWNLELRIALYELSFINYFYSNGCGALATLNRNIRYVLMVPVLEASDQANSKVYASYGISISIVQDGQF
jgi:hypothetical protein